MAEKFVSFINVFGTALSRLGLRRLIALGLGAVALMAVILFSSFYLTRPIHETLYVGLTRDDVNRMGVALGEEGINFDVSSDGTSVQVPVGMAEKARMLLAEKGLPTSNNAGYELFDKMGSLGLTSFMQEITRQRALEGEIARTIQAVQGVKAARVHIVLPDKGSFRRANQKPTASVIIRSDGGFRTESAQAIRQLVAAAVPSLESGSVTVLDTSGQLLASGDDATNGASVMMAALETQLAAKIDNNIRKQLAPYLGLDHFQTSVQVALDTDRRQTNETIFDPESQVARSVRSLRDQDDSQNSRNNDAVGVEQNIPQEEIAAGGGENSSDKRDRREEITNYEISSKNISTISDGYQLKKLSVAVVVDRSKLMAALESDENAANQPSIDEQLATIRQMVAAASGMDESRGDLVQVTAVDFIHADEDNLTPIETPLWSQLAHYVPSLINGGALLAAILLILFLGIRPLMREMRTIETSTGESSPTNDTMPALPEGVQMAHINDGTYSLPAPALGDLRQKMKVPPQTRLEQMMALDEERFAGILRDWIRQDKAQQDKTQTAPFSAPSSLKPA